MRKIWKLGKPKERHIEKKEEEEEEEEEEMAAASFGGCPPLPPLPFAFPHGRRHLEFFAIRLESACGPLRHPAALFHISASIIGSMLLKHYFHFEWL